MKGGIDYEILGIQSIQKKGTYFAIKGKNIRVAVKEDKDTGMELVVVYNGKETYSLLRRKPGDFEIDIDYMKMISIY